MKVIIFFRGILVLLFILVLTPLASLLALLLLLVFRVPENKAQIVPWIWGRLVLAASGVRVRVEGLANLNPGEPYIFAANHLSQFDIFAMEAFFPHDFRWLAKKELFKIPIFGQAMRRAGAIPIDRSHRRSALASLMEAAKRIAAGTSVVIFPEGTRSGDGQLHSFKAGGMVLAIKSGVSVVPVAISGTYEVLPKGGIMVRPGEVVIRVGSPIDPSAYSNKQKHELAADVHEKVAQMLVKDDRGR